MFMDMLMDVNHNTQFGKVFVWHWVEEEELLWCQASTKLHDAFCQRALHAHVQAGRGTWNLEEQSSSYTHKCTEVNAADRDWKRSRFLEEKKVNCVTI